MTYQLTSDSIIIEGREPIARKEFEKWLIAYTSISKKEVDKFWACRIEYHEPADTLQDFIDQQTAFTEFDNVKKGIDRICNSARF
jgi:hypothetical protein